MDIEIGDWTQISLENSHIPIIGTVAYIGEPAFATGIWLGLILIPECRKFAKNNGTVQGKHYFSLNTNGKDDFTANDFNFGIFIKPEKVSKLSIDSLISLNHVSSETKFQLLKDYFHSFQQKYNYLSTKLEMLEIEYTASISDRESLIEELNELKLNYNAIKSLNSSDIPPNQIINKKLELELIQLKENFVQKEYSYIETIEFLKSDLKNLENKINSLNLNDHLLDDLHNSESIIERLTLENSELLEELNNLKDKNNLNNDLINCYEQTESELNNLVNNLEVKIKSLNNDLLIERNNLEKANEIISNFNFDSQNQNQTKSLKSMSSMYSKLINSLNSSFEIYSTFISNKIIHPNYSDLLIFYKSLFQLKEFIAIIISYNENVQNWRVLLSKLIFIENLLPYDTSKYLLQFKVSIDKISSLILHYIEQNDEINDLPLLLSTSTDISMDPNDKKLQDFFELGLLSRELEIYNKSLNGEDTTNLLELQAQNLGFINGIQTQLLKHPFWKISSISNESTNSINTIGKDELEQLRLKIKILQSKLIDEKETQHDLIKLERQLKEEKNLNLNLNLQLDKSHESENYLTNELENLKSKLNKYGINDENSTIDEFELLEINKLLKTIKNQRQIILKLTTQKSDTKFEDLEFIGQKILKPTIPSFLNRRIDQLFDINLQQDANIQQQQLLEYINFY
jgi:chromosome segregation ATPase